uniref:Uncharacterized protein n=1 Tax=Oryza brachyantha TaxID=4533 RepID=J3LCK8_ORYBR
MDRVLVPYTHQNLTWTQHVFNEKVDELRLVAVDVFARLKAWWACLQKHMKTRGEVLDAELRYKLVDDETLPEISVRSETAKRSRDNIAHNLFHRGLAGTTKTRYIQFNLQQGHKKTDMIEFKKYLQHLHCYRVM